MDFYQHNENDPPWLARTADFHGHLGPWLTIGAMIGRDAIARLDTPGQWKIQAVCYMPPAKQRTPFSCLLDGLQATSGATMGKRNLHMDFSPEIVIDDQPVVRVTREADNDRPAETLEYRMKSELIEIMSKIDPMQLEELSREIATHNAESLFFIDPVDAEVDQNA